MTGGYILATYADQVGEDTPASTVFITNYGVEFANDTPEYESEDLTEAQKAQRSYIRGFMQEVENLIMAPGDIDRTRHDEIASKMDLTSLANYWLLQEISFNTDGFGTTSTYLYKKRDGKLYWGPLWDFDYAWWNNDGKWPDANCTFNNTAMLWIDQLRARDPLFVSLLQKQWSTLSGKLEELTAAGGIIDQYAAKVSKSQAADYGTWSTVVGEQDKYDGKSLTEYTEAVNDLKDWIDKRREWADTHIADIGKVYYTVSYEANGQVVATEQVRYGQNAVMDPDAPAPEGKVFEYWQHDGKTPNQLNIVKDTVFTAEYEEAGKAVAPTGLSIDALDELTTVNLSSGFFPVTTRQTDTSVPHSLDELAVVEPVDATNRRIRWTSSDEAVASIDEVSHRVVLNGGGVATITGTLYNGMSARLCCMCRANPPSIRSGS